MFLGEDKPIIKNIFLFGTCTPIIGVDVRCYKTEKEMLSAWSKFVVTVCTRASRASDYFPRGIILTLLKVDPDLLTGYNIVNFDFAYLMERAKKLRIDGFENMSRNLNAKMKFKDAKFSSAQTGPRESKEWSILQFIPYLSSRAENHFSDFPRFF